MAKAYWIPGSSDIRFDPFSMHKDHHQVTVRPNSGEGSRIFVEAGVLLLLIVAGAILLYLPRERADLNFDSSAYAAQSINLALGRGNTMQMGGEDIPGFYPPGYPALTVPFHWILGCHLQNGVPANFIMGLLTLIAVYFIGRSIAGPPAGAAALLFLLSSLVFRHVAQRIFSQMPSLLFVALVGVFILEGWKPGRHSRWFRFAAGITGGMAVLIRSNNVVLAPALALLPLLCPPAGRRRFGGGLALWSGIALSVALVLTYNLIEFGSPIATGYMSWGFSLEKVFSLEYVFNPPFIQMDDKPYQLIRSLLGFGFLYSWPIAVLALPGCVAAFKLRGNNPSFWRLSLITILSTLFLYGFLALYFFRSPIYTMLTLPLIMAVAASAAIFFVRKFENVRPLRRIPLRWIPAVIAGICLMPTLAETHLFGAEWKQKVPPEMTSFQELDALLEQNAVLLGAANPLMGEYLFRRDTDRKYVYLNQRRGEQFTRVMLNELGAPTVTMPLIESYVKKRLEEGQKVYLLIFPFEAREGALLEKTYKFIKKRFILEETEMPGLRRIRIRNG